MKQNISILFLTLFFLACQNSNSVEESTGSLSAVQFDNDSAREALLNRYQNQNPEDFYFQVSENSSTPIDFSEVAPLFKIHCSPCHNPKGNAPFSLNSFRNIHKRSKAIREALVSKIMPPWRADNSYNQYHNNQEIPDSIRNRMIEWIDAGAMASKESQSLSWESKLRARGNLILGPTEKFIIPSEKDIYQCNVIDPKFDSETYVNAFTFHSNNINLVHHYTLFADTSGQILSDSTSFNCKYSSIFNNLILLDSWASGMKSLKLKEGIAYQLPKETKFMVQIHYKGYGNQGKSEQSTIALYTSKNKPQHPIKWYVQDNRSLDIKANTISTDGIVYEVKEDMMLLGIMPHMHYLGKIMEVFAIKPNHKKVKLVYIPDWSYVVQTKYFLKNPEHLPAGTKIYTNVVYDNTSENPEQPNDPIRDVKFDLSGYDEMLITSLYYVPFNKKHKLPEPTVQFIE